MKVIRAKVPAFAGVLTAIQVAREESGVADGIHGWSLF